MDLYVYSSKHRRKKKLPQTRRVEYNRGLKLGSEPSQMEVSEKIATIWCGLDAGAR